MSTVKAEKPKSKTINLTPEQVLEVKCREFAAHAATKAEADAEMKRLSEEIHGVVQENKAELTELFTDKNGKEKQTATLEGVTFGVSKSLSVQVVVDAEKFDATKFYAAFPTVHKEPAIDAKLVQAYCRLDNGKRLDIESHGITIKEEETTSFKVAAAKK